ncbi:carboxypeptidase regulatory-like domain-containing protein [Streptomyces sp. NBC_00102]|uniref:carboxypeptidase regulatory-like domain-containing protein n=1 Tax=Streptomyces sp. NBC_00102 TaxID=2975652 RepID=UPI00224FA015|nr:carboxypeptidase regulatory-like domain-containing protein [Streptomyces sp. NBC_00102]MCX5399968.1 carboxypeptidase regulatory-like domain-containing protein [Streptomyces sp. NBC_00102]
MTATGTSRPAARRARTWPARLTGLTALATASALVVLGLTAPAANAADPADTGKDSKPSVEASCSEPEAGEVRCFALRRTDVTSWKGVRPDATTPDGWGATALQDAYNLSAGGGAGQTIAIVDAYDDPTAEEDLAVYRAQYGLPACTTDNGCFKKVDQRGGTDYPEADSGWAGEISLDLDMVSASAPNANIVLVEADSASFEDMGSAVDQAVAQGAKFVSNSYGSAYSSTPGSGEDPSETTDLDAHYNHPGVAVVASSGDDAYGVAYPAASQYVTSVGGTALEQDSSTSRGWAESVWFNSHGGPGSGCSVYEARPAWQESAGTDCAKRAVSDVSAVADPLTGVSVYQTYGGEGWSVYGGTSASAPIIAGVYAAAGTPAEGSYPAAYPYAADGSGLNDVVDGDNGSCSPATLCTAGEGWDGPTGLGTPDGTQAFRSGPHGVLSGTVTDSATGAPISGAEISAGDSRAESGADGTYTLALAEGTYDLVVDAYGYTTATLPGVEIADGAAVSKDFALAAVQTRTVSGKVTDGSGHGWPLYASIAVDGVPGAPIETDPTNGTYSVDLPAGKKYSLRITSNYPGYRSADKIVTVGDSAVSADVSLPVDAWAGTAAGYTAADEGTTEPFDSTTSAPEGWTVGNAAGTTGGWQFDDPGKRTNTTGGKGAFAIVDSDKAGSGKVQDSTLTSPSYDFTGTDLPEIGYRTTYKSYSGQTARVEVSTDGGTTWTAVSSHTTAVTGSKVTVALTDYAGESDVRVRFHFTGKYGWFWQIDDVFVGARTLSTVPGGLLVGQVADANTGSGVVGATLTGTGDHAVSTATAATPDDAALGDGFYWAFAPVGKQTLTAAKSKYTAAAKAVTFAPDSVTSKDFSLKAGRLKVTPAAVDAPVAWGGSATKNVTVKNTGGAAATVELSEKTGDFAPALSGAPLISKKGDYSPLSSKSLAGGASHPAAAPAEAGDAWQTVADLPDTIEDNAVAVDDGKLYSAFGYNGAVDIKSLYVYETESGWTKLADASDTREAPAHGFIDGKLYAVGGWGADGGTDAKLEIYDPASDTWTTGAPSPDPLAGSGSAVLDGKLYSVGGCTDVCGSDSVTVYDPSDNSWSQAASYPEDVAWQACGAIDALLYCAGGTNDSGELKSAYSYDPAADAWSALPDMPTSLWASSYTAANGLLLASSGVSGDALTNAGYAYDPAAGTWSSLPNADVATYRGGGAPGFYKVGGADGPGSPASTVEVLPGYDQTGGSDVSWLSLGSTGFTLAPGASVTVPVSVKASVEEITQPGAFTAKIGISSDTPYAVASVPVTMTVAAPGTWGKITGTVLGKSSTGVTAPLKGATVQIDSWASSYTLITDEDGHYALWLDARNNPLTVIVAKDGYAPTTTTVKVVKKGTVTTDFTLKKA